MRPLPALARARSWDLLALSCAAISAALSIEASESLTTVWRPADRSLRLCLPCSVWRAHDVGGTTRTSKACSPCHRCRSCSGLRIAESRERHRSARSESGQFRSNPWWMGSTLRVQWVGLISAGNDRNKCARHVRLAGVFAIESSGRILRPCCCVVVVVGVEVGESFQKKIRACTQLVLQEVNETHGGNTVHSDSRGSERAAAVLDNTLNDNQARSK